MKEKSHYEEFVTITTLEDWIRKEVVERNELYIKDNVDDTKQIIEIRESNRLFPKIEFSMFRKHLSISLEENEILLENTKVIEEIKRTQRKENLRELGRAALVGICGMNYLLPAFNVRQALYFSQSYDEKIGKEDTN